MFRPTGKAFSLALLEPNSECQKEIFLAKKLSKIVSRHFWTMCNRFLVWFSKRHSTCPKKKFEEKRVFLKKLYYFWQFRTFSRTLLYFWLECQNWILRPWKNIFKKLLFSKKIIIFSPFSNFQHENGLLASFWSGVSKLQSTYPAELFLEV